MSGWPEQLTEYQRAWVEQQQKLMSDWLKNLQSAGQGTDVWQQMIDVMEQQVNSALEAQKNSLLSLARNAEQTEGMPDAFSQYVQQMEKSVEVWADMQQQVWQNWFEMLKSAAPVSQTPGESLVKNWQDMAQRAMSMQEDWLSNWMSSMTPGSATSGKKSTKSSTPQSSSSSGKKSSGSS